MIGSVAIQLAIYQNGDEIAPLATAVRFLGETPVCQRFIHGLRREDLEVAGVANCYLNLSLSNSPASFEPSIDYVVTKIPRFAFEKFPQADPTLTMQMKGYSRSSRLAIQPFAQQQHPS